MEKHEAYGKHKIFHRSNLTEHNTRKQERNSMITDNEEEVRK